MTAALSGRHALITGGSRGIGLACAERLASMGASLSLVARDVEVLNARAAELSERHGVAVRGYQADALSRSSLAAAASQAHADLGPVHVLVNNVGGTTAAPFHKIDDEAWDQALALNLSSVFATTRAVIGDMKKQDFGRVITIASTAAQRGYAYVAAYVAAKHGALGLMRALALELAKTPITSNAVCPGFVDTDMTKDSIERIVASTGRSAEEARRDLESMNPQARLTTPDQVASAVAWLAHPDQQGVNGIALGVSGGEVMN